jgi:DNA repair protein RadC
MDQQVIGQEHPANIKAWPRGERPRERLLERGAQSLSDAELLAVVFGTGFGGANALDLARQLLQTFGGSLRRLLTAEPALLLRQRGLGPARFATLMAALELARRHYCEALRAGPALNAPAATRQFLTAQLRDRPYEVFCCLHLDLCGACIYVRFHVKWRSFPLSFFHSCTLKIASSRSLPRIPRTRSRHANRTFPTSFR